MFISYLNTFDHSEKHFVESSLKRSYHKLHKLSWQTILKTNHEMTLINGI